MGQRADLLRALQEKRTVADVELIRAAAHYLQRRYDPEVLAAVERAFGMSISDLQATLHGSHKRDFVYQGANAWLRTYLEITSMNEAPGIFHALAALAVASVVIGRRTWLSMGFYDVYPPLGVILVGPSGARKTVAINTAARMLPATKISVNVIRERFTPEALIAALRGDEDRVIQNKTAFVVSPEMAVTFGKSHYLEGLVPLFTRLMDHEGYEVRTKGGGTFTLANIALGFLGATTKEWLTTEMNASVVQGGFTSRFLLSYAATSPRIIWRVAETSSAAIQSLGEELGAAVGLQRGAMTIEPAADAFLEQWYAAHRLEGNDQMGTGYHSRKHAHLLRLALIFAVLDRATQIAMPHIIDALQLLDYLEPGMLELTQELSSSQTARDAGELVTILRRAGGRLTKTVFISACVRKMTMGRFYEAYAFLKEAGRLEEIKSNVILRRTDEDREAALEEEEDTWPYQNS